VHKTFRFVTLDAEHFDFRGCPVLFTPLIEMMPIMLVLLMSAAPVALPVMFTLKSLSLWARCWAGEPAIAGSCVLTQADMLSVAS
jgi:hypothetical protein